MRQRKIESILGAGTQVLNDDPMQWMQHLPRQFVRESGLAFRRCVVTLIDQKKRSWKVWLNYKDSDGQSYVNRGWKAFQDANPLKPGDVIRLQLLNPGKYPVFKCCSK